jgi:hypothetical protein
MSPVIGLRPRCTRCRQRPVWMDTLCNPCWRLLAAFGHLPADVGPSRDPAEPLLEILDADSIEFERRLVAWLSAADP